MGMPLADLFAPDVNFQTARNVYPTAPGGSLASAAGAMTANTTVPMVAADGNGGTAGGAVGHPGFTTSGKSLGWWVGFLALLMVMVFVARKAGGDDEFRNIKPTFYNVMAITLTAIVGIVGRKVIATRWRVPGASDVRLAV